MANEAYFPGIPETDKVKTSQYLLINNEKTGKPDKIQLGNFLSNLNIQTDSDITNNVLEVTYAEAQALVASSSLVVGEHYKLTDKADLGIILLAVSNNQFSLEGEGIFLNPDFQGVGSLAFNIKDVWYAGGEGGLGYVNGDVVFWNGLHYQVTDSGAFAGTDPSVTPLAYTLLSKSVANGYIEETDFILYDFDSDRVIERNDKRGNKIRGYASEPNNSAIDVFQWGNDLVKSNIVQNFAYFECYNNRGRIFGNILSLYVIVNVTNENLGELYNNIISGQYTITADFDAFVSLTSCNIFTPYSFTFINTISSDRKMLDFNNSTFEVDIDITTRLVAGTLTLATAHKYIGIFNLLNSAGQTVDKIVNLPATHKCRFYPTAGATQLFSHTAIAGAILDQLISDAAAINTITGRTNGSDFIEYERAGNLNRRYNAVIAA